MSWKILVVACAAVLGLSEGASRSIPDYIHICKRSDPRVSKCVRESVEVLRPRLRTGIPELAVPGLEPLRLKEIAIFRGEGDSNNFRAYLRNVDVTGASNFEIAKIKVDVEKMTYRVGVKFNTLELNGDYEIDARVLVVPLRGTGKFSANVTNAEGHGVLKAELVEKDGHREIRFNKFDFAIRVGDYNIRLDNLFNGDPVLSKAGNEVLNDNKKEFIAAALPFIQRKVAEILLEASNRITDGLDYDQVFPEK